MTSKPAASNNEAAKCLCMIDKGMLLSAQACAAGYMINCIDAQLRSSCSEIVSWNERARAVEWNNTALDKC